MKTLKPCDIAICRAICSAAIGAICFSGGISPYRWQFWAIQGIAAALALLTLRYGGQLGIEAAREANRR